MTTTSSGVAHEVITCTVWTRLVITQMACASLSLFSSFLVIISILRESIRTDSGETCSPASPYRRIVLGLSVSDLVQSISLLCGPFSLPYSSHLGPWAIGNDNTCRANGFFFSFAAGSNVMYMSGLCLYKFLKIKCNMNDEIFAKKIERVMHLFIIVSNLVPSVIALRTKSINGMYLGSFCTFGAFPEGCHQRPDLFGECESERIANPAIILAIYSYLVIPTFCLFGIVGCMRMVCKHIFLTTRLPNRNRNRHPLRMATLNEVSDDSISSDSSSEVSNMNENQSAMREMEEYRLQRMEHNVRQSERLIMSYRRQYISQACWIVVAFAITFFFWYITNWILLVGKEPSTALLSAFVLFYPLTGFANFLLFAQQKISTFRIRNSECSYFQIVCMFVKSGGESPRDVESSIESSITMSAFQINSIAFRAQERIVNQATIYYNPEASIAAQYFESSSGSTIRPPCPAGLDDTKL